MTFSDKLFAFLFLRDVLDMVCTDQKMKIMASHSITSWQIHGETMKTVTSFIFLGSKITGNSDFGCEKRDADPWKIKL